MIEPKLPMWPEGYDRVVLAETDSTMSEARRRAAAQSGPIWMMAERQTVATGRRGRAWVTPEGNFGATLYLPLKSETPANAALRSFVAALALHDALGQFIDPSRLSLKWPNDVLLNGGKVAGILLESSGAGETIDGLSIGIGVNLIDAPQQEAVETGAFRPVGLHDQGGRRVGREDFLDALATAYAAREQSFQDYGFEPTRRLWRHPKAVRASPPEMSISDTLALTCPQELAKPAPNRQCGRPEQPF